MINVIISGFYHDDTYFKLDIDNTVCLMSEDTKTFIVQNYEDYSLIIIKNEGGTYDYPVMKKTKEIINQQVMEYVYHPSRFNNNL